MKNPLYKYEKYQEVIHFLGDNLACPNGIVVPYAEGCYFYSPLFRKFRFFLNFVDDAPYEFWRIYKEDRLLLLKTIDVFKKYSFADDRQSLEKMMHNENRPLFKAVLFMFLHGDEVEKTFVSSMALDMRGVSLTKNKKISPSDFVLHSCVDNFSLNDEKLEFLNNFKSKIIIANNPTVAQIIDYDHKIDFDDSYVLISSQ